MQSLLVEALALRQLGRLNPRQLLTPGYGFKQTNWCPRMMHTRQLWGSSVCFTVGSHRPVVCGRGSKRIWSLHQLRFKSSKKKGLAKVLEEENDSDSDLDTDDSDSDDEEDPNLPQGCKEFEKFVLTYSYDAFFKSGTGMSSKKFGDAFSKNKFRLNGKKFFKKSTLVNVGDTLDLVLSENAAKNTVTLMRVVFQKVIEETDSERDTDKVVLRHWKRLKLPKDVALKP